MITSLIILSICAVLIAIGIVVFVLSSRRSPESESGCLAGMIVSIAGIVCAAFLGMVLGKCYYGLEGTYEDHIEQREFLVHVLETHGYSEYDKQDFFDEVEHFNTCVRVAESRAESPWYNWFADRTWLGIEPIETEIADYDR